MHPKKNSVAIRVPASTANLGPGFDCLGLCLDIWNDIVFEFAGNSLQIEISGEGFAQLPKDENNLIFQCFSELAAINKVDIPPGLIIRCYNNIPVSSGLGSSSSAVVAGLMGARALLKLDVSDLELIKIGRAFEGHIDNISACLLGGFSISGFSDDEVIARSFHVKEMRVVIAVPDINLSTKSARQILPDNVKLSDAVHNIFQTALLSHAIRDGDISLINKSTQDRLHQKYRLHLIPGGQKAIDNALSAGAFCAFLSGAGPSIVAFAANGHDHHQIALAMQQAFTKYEISARILNTRTTNQGAFFVK